MQSVRLNSIEGPGAEPVAKSEPTGSASFSDTLTQAVGQLDSLQTSADQQASQVATGDGNLHETAIALEKADVSMRLAMKVRNKVVDAYQEVMRMSV